MDPRRHKESTLPTAPLKLTLQILHKERISSPDLNSKETAHVTTTYSCEPLSKLSIIKSCAINYLKDCTSLKRND